MGNFIDFTRFWSRFIVCFWEEKILDRVADRRFCCKGGLLGVCGFLVHLSFSEHQPFYVQARVMKHESLDEIEARIVPSGEYMRNACTYYIESVRKLCLGDVFSCKKLT